MPAWPATLPDPSVATYAIKPQTAVERTAMEKGPARLRRITTRSPRDIPIQVVLTLDEVATFEAWFDQVIDSGAAWFDMRLINGLGIQISRARFKGDQTEAYTLAPQGNGQVWALQSTLEVEALPQLTADQLAGRL